MDREFPTLERNNNNINSNNEINNNTLGSRRYFITKIHKY